MVSPFEFATAGRILFGAGRVLELPEVAAQLGSRALVVTGGKAARAQPQIDALQSAGMSIACFAVAHEPTTESVQRGAELARASNAQCVIGIGGGSVIDAAKAIAALATNRADVSSYLEIIGRNQPLTEAPLPVIAVPTTAGTGAEVTRNAVLHSPEHRVKVSLRHALMLPRVAIVDPELTLNLPPALTASTGMDALTQLIEPFVSKRANPFAETICREGLPRVSRALRRAFENGSDLDARTDMALASLLGGIALANAGLGAVHGFAGPIGGMFPAPHGTVCAALLSHVMEANVAAARDLNLVSLANRFEQLSVLLIGSRNVTACLEWLCALCADLGVPRLSAFGVQRSDLDEIARKAAASSSMKGNPVEFTESQLVAILERAL